MTGQLVWLITGTSSGIGHYLTLAALRRGDKVIATGRARSLHKLEELRALGADVLELDVTAPLNTLHEIAKEAVAIHGSVDVVVNNAGYAQVGAIEEGTCVDPLKFEKGIHNMPFSPEESFDQFNTHIFGALNVSRAFLPYMRQRKTGTIVFIGSLTGWQGVQNAGLYSATKFAMRGISRTLHAEIAPLGLRSTCIEFGHFRTSLLTTDNRSLTASRIADYKPLWDRTGAQLEALNGNQPGDPLKGANVVVDVVRGEGSSIGRKFPTVLALGSDCYDVVRCESEATLIALEKWKDVTTSTDFS